MSLKQPTLELITLFLDMALDLSVRSVLLLGLPQISDDLVELFIDALELVKGGIDAISFHGKGPSLCNITCVVTVMYHEMALSSIADLHNLLFFIQSRLAEKIPTHRPPTCPPHR
jgi:hypothetical protein